MTRVVFEPTGEFGLIYGLHDGDGVIRYVGQTRRLRARINEHLSSARARRSRMVNEALGCWLRDVEELHVRVLDSPVATPVLGLHEKAWITRLQPDLNMRGDHQAGGGNGQRGSVWTLERRAAQSERMRQWHARGAS